MSSTVVLTYPTYMLYVVVQEKTDEQQSEEQADQGSG